MVITVSTADITVASVHLHEYFPVKFLALYKLIAVHETRVIRSLVRLFDGGLRRGRFRRGGWVFIYNQNQLFLSAILRVVEEIGQLEEFCTAVATDVRIPILGVPLHVAARRRSFGRGLSSITTSSAISAEYCHLNPPSDPEGGTLQDANQSWYSICAVPRWTRQAK